MSLDIKLTDKVTQLLSTVASSQWLVALKQDRRQATQGLRWDMEDRRALAVMDAANRPPIPNGLSHLQDKTSTAASVVGTNLEVQHADLRSSGYLHKAADSNPFSKGTAGDSSWLPMETPDCMLSLPIQVLCSLLISIPCTFFVILLLAHHVCFVFSPSPVRDGHGW